MELSGEKIARVEAAIDRAALEPACWQHVTDCVYEETGAIAYLLGYDEKLPTALPTTVVQTGVDPSFVETFETYYHQLNPWLPAIYRMRAGEIATFEQMLPTAALERTEYYNDWLRPQGDLCCGSATMLFCEADRHIGFGGLMPSRHADKNAAPLLELMGRIAPRLSHAFEVNRAMAGAMLSHLFDWSIERHMATAIVIVDASGRVTFANFVGEALIEDGIYGGVDFKGRFHLFDRQAQQKLGACLRGLSDDGPATATTFFAGRDRGPKDLLCRTFRVFDDMNIPVVTRYIMGASEPHLGLAFTPRGLPEGSARMLSLHLSLTQSEAEVAVAVADGMNTSEIAKDRGTTVQTVRNQLKTTFSKAGVRSQAELVRLVMDVIVR